MHGLAGSDRRPGGMGLKEDAPITADESRGVAEDIVVSRGLVVAVAWCSNGWVGQSETPSDWEDSGFEDVRERHSAHEWWNFALDHPSNVGGMVYGYFHPSGRSHPRIDSDERLAVFFASRRPADGGTYVVGAYLGAEFSAGGWPESARKEEGGFESDSNLRCPRDQVWVAQPKTLLRLDRGRHLRGAAIGRRNFTYVELRHVRTMLRDLQVARTAWETDLVARIVGRGE